MLPVAYAYPPASELEYPQGVIRYGEVNQPGFNPSGRPRSSANENESRNTKRVRTHRGGSKRRTQRRGNRRTRRSHLRK